MKRILLSLLAIMLVTISSFSQFPEDALRLSLSGPGIGARSLGLGMTYTGIATDYTAAYWNPAGLAQIKRNEFSLGLSHFSYGNTSSFQGNSSSFTNSATNLNDVGLVYSFPTTQGSLVLAFGYGRSNDFTTGLSFSGDNPYSSMVPSLDYDLAYELYLVDSVGNTPIQDSVEQQGRVLEDGGLNNWMISGAVEAAQNLFLGATLNFISGSYTYNRDFSEFDVYDKYTAARFGADYAIDRWKVINTIDGDISGFTMRLGMLYKFNNRSRLGFNIKLPTSYTIREEYASEGTSTFDVPDQQGNYSYYYRIPGATEYDVTTPFVFSGGFSIGSDDLILASDVEYTDWTQMKFKGDPYLEQYNTDIKEIFTPTFNFHVGAEFHVPESSLRLRGGFAYIPSPYKDDPTDYDQKYVTGGLGVLMADVLMLDLGFAHGFWETSHVNYQHYNNAGKPLSETKEKITTNNVMATISYRF
ncbi:MAG: hypothetical protein EPO24_00740 [Bacteroidetes bacterium]|nr:MAG: hypothetical protein EPO24_00740 [Bacteroidota bacterium]